LLILRGSIRVGGMGPVEKQIQILLQSALDPIQMEIINESYLHEGHEHMGPETHFRVVAVSKVFEGLKSVQRYRIVHQALGDLLKDKIHALTLQLYAPGEQATQS
jgi:BolA family transcriptional regulator, general stress-responsive regulator